MGTPTVITDVVLVMMEFIECPDPKYSYLLQFIARAA